MNVLNATDVTDVINISYDSYYLSSTSDTPQVTTTGEVLKTCHYKDKVYNVNDPLLLPYGSSPFRSRPPGKPPFPKQHHNINLHDMSTYEFLQAHVHELENSKYDFLQSYFHELVLEVVPDDAITDDPPVDKAEHEPPDILLINAETGSHHVLHHDIKEHEQWGEVITPESSFNDYKHLVIVNHLPYVQSQDDELNDDAIDPSVLDPQTSQGPHNPELLDEKGKELGLPPENSLPVPTPFWTKVPDQVRHR
jgi:hypothetical protein